MRRAVVRDSDSAVLAGGLVDIASEINSSWWTARSYQVNDSPTGGKR